jgi:putative Ig domain-containing protein
MRIRPLDLRLLIAVALVVSAFTACGGGSSGGPPPPPPPPPPGAVLTIVTPPNLPGTLTNAAYTATLQASNAVGALTWSIAPISPTALFVSGLSVDPHTGVLSGAANFSGTAGFVATVTDSASPPKTATKGFTITASAPLQAPSPQTVAVGQYQSITPAGLNFFSGGVWPFTYTLTSGALPLGLRLDTVNDVITGSATTVGMYPITVTVQDSYTPPEVVSEQITVQVIPPQLSIANSVPRQILLNRPFSGKVIANGGIPPYSFALSSGSMPAGLSSIDPFTGQFNGTPTALGGSGFTVTVTDSSSPAKTASASFFINVVNPIGRNDSVATATPLGNGLITASISPYIDPPATPVAGDNDFYKLVSLSGKVVHVQTFARQWWPGNPLDTVIEILDGNGNQLTTCQQPGTSTGFASACVNDDDASLGTTDSTLDLQVPGPANTATTFYVHVLDWRGDARPDMQYGLNISGLVSPLSIQSTTLMPAALGLSYSQQLSAANPIGSVSWSISTGALPAGLTLNSSGSITGAATLKGTYSFTLVATDSGNPPQTASVQESIQVVDPIQITSPAVWPTACVNQPYTFAIQTSGGVPPFFWSFISNSWVGIGLDQSTGIFSGSSSVTGTFTGLLGVGDSTQHGVSQQVTLNVAQCPGG